MINDKSLFIKPDCLISWTWPIVYNFADTLSNYIHLKVNFLNYR